MKDNIGNEMEKKMLWIDIEGGKKKVGWLIVGVII